VISTAQISLFCVPELTVAKAAVAAPNGGSRSRFDDNRMPEVYTGHPRSEAVFPVWYPRAATPQGWAAAAPLFLVRTLLGLEFSHGQARADPSLPPKMRGLCAAGRPLPATGRCGRLERRRFHLMGPAPPEWRPRLGVTDGHATRG
jgi:hypothetical protein